MPVTVRIPPILREVTGGERTVQGEGPTVAALFAHLDSLHPGLHDRLFADEGVLRRFVNVYVNDEDIRYLEQLETPVADGDTVSILPAVAGG